MKKYIWIVVFLLVVIILWISFLKNGDGYYVIYDYFCLLACLF